jgi:putative Ca2+/H+ antiporter (TMEM165/GDT1 family)
VEAFFVSAVVVALAEIGDKTQILSLMLAARFRRAPPVLAGILLATLANHAAAGLMGMFFGTLLTGASLRWLLGLSFVSFSLWALFPEKGGAQRRALGGGAFVAALCAFFVAELGDRTQLATIGLAARFGQLYAVVGGTTLGMMLANIPAVLIGGRLAERLPVRAIRLAAAFVFAGLGLLTLFGGGR